MHLAITIHVHHHVGVDSRYSMGTVDALYLLDEHHTPLLEHVYRGRPPASSTLLPLYLAHAVPRPPLLYLANTRPPTLLYSLAHDQLLLLCPCAADTAPLHVLEWLHRVADVLELVVGAPLLAARLERHGHVVAQLLSEMADGGLVAATEPNALRDLVDAPSLLKSLLGATPSSLASLAPAQEATATAATATVPWRSAAVRHTSNEVYVDLVETLDVTLAPSGRPLAAVAHGTIAFTAKLSGVPDLLLHLACPGGISSTVSLPVFHPCVRLGRWKERPGELSFVPPDGRFVLAGYQVDLLGPAALDAFATTTNNNTTTTASSALPKLNIPATVSVTSSLGPSGADFEVKLQLNPRFAGKASVPVPTTTIARGGGIAAFASATGTTSSPAIEEMLVHIPLPTTVKNIADLRLARGTGDASYAPGDRAIDWRLTSREISALMSQDRGGGLGASATLRGTVIGVEEDHNHTLDTSGPVPFSHATYDYHDYHDDDKSSQYRVASPDPVAPARQTLDADAKRKKANRLLMPSCATLSFSVKGWLPSGIRVEALNVDPKRSKGLGSGVTPYKGVKYLCLSRDGIECRS